MSKYAIIAGTMFPAIFLDRDGVIIQNRDTYVRTWEDVEFLPGSLKALADLKRIPHKIVIVTNQSVVGRGLISLETANQINQRIVEIIQDHGGRIDGAYICPHTPEDRCTCRKPQPGLLLQAAKDLPIDLSHSVMIGDALSDLQAGKAAGIPRLVLVQTGRGADQLRLPAVLDVAPYEVFDSLEQVVRAMLKIR
jgi:D-glycero-D-manno-heptose 1,7-bisphosphate phosphatase